MSKIIYTFAFALMSLLCCGRPTKSIVSSKFSSIDSEQQKYIPVKYITRVSGNVQFPTGVYNVSKWQLLTIGYFPYNSGYCKIFGAWYSDKNWTGYGLDWNYTDSSRPVHGNKYGNYWYGYMPSFDYSADHILDCVVTEQSCSISFDGYTQSAKSSVGLNGEQIYLLGNGHRTIATGFGLGETTILQNDAIVAHLVPCIRASDKTPVFYDDINDVEVENEGDGIVGFIEF